MTEHDDQYGGDRPNIPKAKQELAEVKSRRWKVEHLIAALTSERQQNNFSANIFVNHRRN